MPDPKVVIRTNATPVIRRTPEYKVYYANQSRMRLAPSDIQIYFGQLAEEPGVDSPFNDEMLSVIVAPQHAKLLAVGLQTAIQAFESQFGEIKLPEDAEKASQATRDEVMEYMKRMLDANKPPAEK